MGQIESDHWAILNWISGSISIGTVGQLRRIKQYKEVITAYNSACFLLSSIGLRTLIEGICVDKGVVGSTLNQMIDNATFIPEGIRKNIHSFRFLGNQATHELFSPNKEDLQIAIYVIEDILNLTYDLDYKCKVIYEKFKK